MSAAEDRAAEVLAAHEAEASTERLASDLCASGHGREDGGHCQECYDIACAVLDSPWFAALPDPAPTAAASEGDPNVCSCASGRGQRDCAQHGDRYRAAASEGEAVGVRHLIAVNYNNVRVICTCGHDSSAYGTTADALTKWAGHLRDVAARAAQPPQDAGLRTRIEAVLPDECWVTRQPADVVSCTQAVGGTFSNGAEFVAETCCLPCRLRAALGDQP